MARKRRRMGSREGSKLQQAANAAAGWCEQEFGTGRFDPAEDACKHGVNRLVRIIRKVDRR